IAAEVLGKPVTRLAPISRGEALRMIDKLPARKVLDAMRGRPPFDIAALADIIVRVGLMIANHDDLRELDLNPVRLFERGKGAAILDVRMIPGA
ncbi:MAG: acetate--CoA ligase family protein, partial [Deltaproteobacteria bacterium]|nr:acetate--CoA ligase family protein [Deltaproteobacteria bacterium]